MLDRKKDEESAKPAPETASDNDVTLLPDFGPGQEGYDHRSGRIGEEPPGPDFGVNVS